MNYGQNHTEIGMQLSFKRPRRRSRSHPRCLGDLRDGEEAILDRIELPEEVSHRLMELGFLPGATVVAARSAPGGDPRVFRVDGSEFALRGETARHLLVRVPKKPIN
jgi:ferrous iron transport protein A